ncbi:MAG: clostripain-related cysteine peptidase [Chloroflexota bacterium]
MVGAGGAGYSGDGGLAVNAIIYRPSSIVVDYVGNIYFTDSHNHRIRKIHHATGIITTIAGTGVAGSTGDNGLAINAQLRIPFGLSIDNNENLFIAELGGHRIRKVSLSTGIITTIAGTGVAGYSGDNGPATNAQFWEPRHMSVDSDRNLFVSDFANHRVRKIEGIAAKSFTNCASIDEMSVTECEALVALYSSTDGDNWTNNTDWLQTTTPCSWHGVACNDNHVTELRLSNNQLSGAIPAELGDLTKLIMIQVDQNDLSGPLPQTVIRLNILNQFYFDNTDLCEPVNIEVQNWLSSINDLVRTNELCITPLHMEKTVSQSVVQVGDELLYSIRLTATVPLSNVNLSDELPVGLTYVENSVSGGATDVNGEIQYQGSLPTGVHVIAYRAIVNDDLFPGGLVNNTAIVTAQVSQEYPLTLQHSATIVRPSSAKGKTLVLLYAVGDNNLANSILDLMNHAEQAAGNENLIIRALLDGPGDDDTYVYELEPDQNLFCPNYMDTSCDGLYVLGENYWSWADDTASYYSLAQFVASGMTAYPDAEKVILSVVGHGNGWAPNIFNAQPGDWEDGSGGPRTIREEGPVVSRLGGMLHDDNPSNSLPTKKFAQALYDVTQATGRTIDLLYLDMCSMAMVEVLYEVRNSVDYVLASESITWDAMIYDELLNAIDEDMEAEAIGRAWHHILSETFRQGGYPFTLSLSSTEHIGGLLDALNTLANSLIALLPDHKDRIEQAVFDSECFESNYDGVIDDYDTYCDLGSLLNQLQVQFSGYNQTVVSAAAYAFDILTDDIVLANDFTGNDPQYDTNVTPSWQDIHGVSIYFPLHKEEKQRYYNKYHLHFAKDGQWDELIATYWDGDTGDYIPLEECEDTHTCPELGDPQPTLPVIIIDNDDHERLTIVGDWMHSVIIDEFYKDGYLHNQDDRQNEQSIQFTPVFSQTCDYRVEQRWTAHPNRATNVPVDISHANGVTTVLVNQQQNGGQWNALGTYRFNQGSSGYVKIRTDGVDGHVIADAVRFVAVDCDGTMTDGATVYVESSPMTMAVGISETITIMLDTIGYPANAVMVHGRIDPAFVEVLAISGNHSTFNVPIIQPDYDMSTGVFTYAASQFNTTTEDTFPVLELVVKPLQPTNAEGVLVEFLSDFPATHISDPDPDGTSLAAQSTAQFISWMLFRHQPH